MFEMKMHTIVINMGWGQVLLYYGTPVATGTPNCYEYTVQV